MCPYTSTYKLIQSDLKDKVISKLLDKVINQDKELVKYKNENDELKLNLVIILKNSIYTKTNSPLVIQKKQLTGALSNKGFSSSKLNNSTSSLTKGTLTQCFSSDFGERVDTRLNNYVNRLYKRNKNDLTLSYSLLKNSCENSYIMLGDKKLGLSCQQTEASTIKNAKMRIISHNQSKLSISQKISSRKDNKGNVIQVSHCRNLSGSLSGTSNKTIWPQLMKFSKKSRLGSSDANDKSKQRKILIKIHKKAVINAQLHNKTKS